MLDTRLDTVHEEALDDPEIPLACNEVYLRLVEVVGYQEAFSAGRPFVQTSEYQQKKERAISAAQTFLESEQSHRIGWARARIEVVLASLTQSDAGQRLVRQDIEGVETPTRSVKALVTSRGWESLNTLPVHARSRAASDADEAIFSGGAHRLWRKMSSFSARSAGTGSSYRSSSASGFGNSHAGVLEELELPQINVGAALLAANTQAVSEVHGSSSPQRHVGRSASCALQCPILDNGYF